MKFGFYPKLAADGIRKNKRMYLPYILTCIGMVMMTYILSYIKFSPVIAGITGGETFQELMQVGIAVIVVFSALFLFYTNSFLTKRRKKEFGLYNILGMGKKDISKIILWETVVEAVISMIMGLLFGIAFSKLVELGFVNVLEDEITYSMSIPIRAVYTTVLAFAVIFLLLFLNSLRQIWFSGAISLLRSENMSEKPPKANRFFGILGVLILGAAYYIAVTTKDPLSAITTFIIAVIMVIAATYLIMIAGSVLLCNILQKSKSYYYKPNHFVFVSSMVYRMRRNGAGLASICILATMVLVMLSSTSAMFIGRESVIYSRYPRELNTQFHMYENKDVTAEDQAMFEKVIDGILKKYGASASNVIKYHSVTIAGMLNSGEVIFDTNDVTDLNIDVYSDLHQFYLIPVEDYNYMMGANETLDRDEVLIYAPKNTFNGETFGFTGQKQYKVKEIIKDCFLTPNMLTDIVPAIMVIVPDITDAAEGLTDAYGNELAYKDWEYGFDTSADKDTDIAIYEEIEKTFKSLKANSHDTFTYDIASREYNRQDFYSLYGGLFYLGIILSIVFIFAAVLIIYYKQISEGYEDVSRFEIMQKVGMTKKDIRKSINSQLLTVFFLPPGMAGLHLGFAFPIIEKLLLCFNLNNRPLFIGTTIGSFLVFALFYVIVYRITSNAYYQIVSGSRHLK